MAVLNRTLAPPKPKATAALRVGPILLVAGASIIIIGLLRVVQTSQATTANFAVQELQQEKLELETSVRQLEADVAGLSSLARIEREAKRLGLVPPAAYASVDVNVAWEAAGERLPTRFAPEETNEAGGGDLDGSPWWQDVLRHLPFY